MHLNRPSSSEPDSNDATDCNVQNQESSYLEGVTISLCGPSRDCAYGSHLDVEGEQNFKETVVFEKRMLPHVYCTSLIVDTACATATHYVESIGFKPRWVARFFAETVFSYPREAKKRYVTTFVYDPDSMQCRYVAGLRIRAPVNCVDLGPVEDCAFDCRLSPGPKWIDRVPPPFSSGLENGQVSPESRREILPKCENGLDGGRHHKGLDENCNVFNTTKQIVIG